MRLIDADELMDHVYRDRLDSRELIAEMIEGAPTVDAVPVVRCEQCKWWDTGDVQPDGRKRCELLDYMRFEPEFFCKYGERKEE